MAQNYETYGGNFILRPPYAIEQMTGYGVAVNGDLNAMQKLCDRTLNANGTHPRYIAVAPTVLFTFMNMGRVRCVNPPESGHGFFTEKELNVTMLLAAIDEDGIRLVWYMPYLWLDSGAALIAGRDVYGFPKQLATVTMPLVPGDPARMSANGEVLHRFGSGAATREDIVTIRRTDAPNLAFASSVPNITDALAILLQSVLNIDPGFLPIGSLLPQIQVNNLLMTWMRQLPSFTNFKESCFRSVVEAPFSVTTFRDAGLLAGNYELVIPQHDSVNIAGELGLGTGDVTVSAMAAYHMSFDFQFADGRELWSET